MPDFAAPVERLIDALKHLPGIGQKTAQRLAFHLLRASPEEAMALSDAIRDAKEKIRECTTCHNITDTNPCLYCVGPTRNHKTICVVEEAHNILAIEKMTKGKPDKILEFQVKLGDLRGAADQMYDGFLFVLSLWRYFRVREKYQSNLDLAEDGLIDVAPPPSDEPSLPKRPPEPRKINPHLPGGVE